MVNVMFALMAGILLAVALESKRARAEEPEPLLPCFCKRLYA
jgi:hypothetical protein